MDRTERSGRKLEVMKKGGKTWHGTGKERLWEELRFEALCASSHINWKQC
jgi:hypothetical protein